MIDSSMVAQAAPDRDQELSNIADCTEIAIRHARTLGADSSEVSASIHNSVNVNVRLGEVETLEHSRDRGMGISVYINDSKGHASSADLREQSIRLCVEKAIDIARFTQADKCNGLAPAERMCTNFPDLDLWHPQPLDAGAITERALACEAAGLDCPDIANSDGASASASYGLNVYANSNGFIGRRDGTLYGQSCVLIAGEGDSMQRDYWYDSRRVYSELEDAEKTGRKAAQRTVRRLGARKIPTCDVPVLFAPEVSKGIIGHFLGAISGGALYRKASFLQDSVGKQLFPEWLRMSERPFIKRGPGSAAFDAEGVATFERDIISGGVLTGYVLGSYSACRLGLETTANAGGVHNLVVEPGRYSQNEMIQLLGTGLMVTEVMGQGVSIVTGDYSRGVGGFWVEHGVIQHPVDEVTIAGHLKDMFMGISAIGNDIDTRSNILIGSMLMSNMTVAGS